MNNVNHQGRHVASSRLLDACVYTTMIGDYEKLNEQAAQIGSSLRFICLTDNPNLESETWEMRLVEPIFARDPIRTQRDLKIRPHVYLPEIHKSIYMDNSVLLKSNPDHLLNLINESLPPLAIPPHSFRESVLDEFLEVSRLEIDGDVRIFEQLNHYMLSCPEVLEERPWWSAIMVRDHRSTRLRQALETWALHVMRYSRRDQLSINMALRSAGIQPTPLRIDNFASDFHSWPHMVGRDRSRGERKVARSMMPLAARLRAAETERAATASHVARLEARLAAVESEQRAVLRSTSWRITAPLRWLRRVVGLMEFGRWHAALRQLYAAGRRGLAALLPERVAEWARVIRKIRAAMRAFDGTTPSLLRPISFNHKMQWRKLFELEPAFAILSDKIAAREYVAARIGPGHQAPLLWTGTRPEDIPFDSLTPPYILKSNHAAGHMILVRQGETPDRGMIRQTAARWLAHCHGSAMSEPGYIHIPRRLMVEAWLGRPDGSKATEYSFFCFDGRAQVVQTRGWTPDGQLRNAGFHTRDWDYLPIRMTSVPDPVPPARPARLEEAISLAERLSAGLSHARVDFYDCGDRLLIGEITLYSYSGMAAFQDRQYDFLLGSFWKIRWPALRAIGAVLFRRWEIRPPGSR